MRIRDAAHRVRDWNAEAGHLDHDLLVDEGHAVQASRELAIDIIREEVDELEAALNARDEVETLDAICDIIYTTLGAAAKAGVWDIVEEGFQEVCRSNDSKLLGERETEASGKTGKGSEYTPPDLHRIVYGTPTISAESKA